MVDDYIKRESLRKKFMHEYSVNKAFKDHKTAKAWQGACMLLDIEPAADVVEVVRCKDCDCGEVDDPDFPNQYYCHAGCGWNDAGFYCGYGERRDNDGQVD